MKQPKFIGLNSNRGQAAYYYARKHRKERAANQGEAFVSVSTVYFSAAQTVAITPAYGAGWDATLADIAGRRKLLNGKEAGELITLASISGMVGDMLFRQYVGLPMIAQTISGTVKSQVRAQDVGAAGDVLSKMRIAIYSGDGLTERGVLLDLDDYSSGAFWNSAIRNKTFADGDALTEVEAQSGDVLVIEIGAHSMGGGVGRLSVGAPSATADLPEDETTTTALVPWVEFSNALRFQA